MSCTYRYVQCTPVDLEEELISGRKAQPFSFRTKAVEAVQVWEPVEMLKSVENVRKC